MIILQIVSESVVSATLKQLQKNFPSTKRYRDSQNQNTERPCFFVEQLSLPVTKQMNNRSIRNYRIKITYLAGAVEGSLSKHFREVGDKLLDVFQRLFLSDTDLVFGRNPEYEIVGDELIFTVEYPMHVILSQTYIQPQTNLELNINVK